MTLHFVTFAPGSVGFGQDESGSVESRGQSGSVGFSRGQSGSVGISRVQSGSVGVPTGHIVAPKSFEIIPARAPVRNNTNCQTCRCGVTIVAPKSYEIITNLFGQ